MKLIYKFLIILVKDFSIFSSPGLRGIRWWLYRKFFKAPKLFVDSHVTIAIAHTNLAAKFNVLGELNIGKDVYIDYSGGVTIGNRVAISEGAKIYTHNHEIHDGNKDWHNNPIKFSSIIIEDYAWISASAIVLPSVDVIGEGAIIAAGAVLTKNAERYGIYAGNPARKIGQRRINETD